MSAQRKTLSIKTKNTIGMWSGPSPVELIEQKLKADARNILMNYNPPKGAAYYESFRQNAVTLRQMSTLIKEALEQLDAAKMFPNEKKAQFQRMTQNVYDYLKQEVGDDKSSKFREALQFFLHPKEALPKVPVRENHNSFAP